MAKAPSRKGDPFDGSFLQWRPLDPTIAVLARRSAPLVQAQHGMAAASDLAHALVDAGSLDGGC
jgi:hypothetical protein